MRPKLISLALVALVALLASAGGVTAQEPAAGMPTGSAFSYQGRLTDGGQPANGTYDFRFRLFDQATQGSLVGAPNSVEVGNVAVSDGLFTVLLNFGAAAFNGQARWLEIAVRPGDSDAGYQPLAPRQLLAPSPYALFSLRAPWSGLLGVPAGFADGADADTLAALSCAAGQIPAWNGSAWACAQDAAGSGDITAVGAGAGLSGGGESGAVSLAVRFAGSGSAATAARSDHSHDGRYALLAHQHDAADITGGSLANDRFSAYADLQAEGALDANAAGDLLTRAQGDTRFWRLRGNGGTSANNFLGTTDNRPLLLKVNDRTVLRLAPAGAGTPNLLGGWGGNSVLAGVQGAAIGGGGLADDGSGNPEPNRVTDEFGTIGGGSANLAGDDDGNALDAPHATVGGGSNNRAGSSATVGGGANNVATGPGAAVAGGINNQATGQRATVAGGFGNDALGNFATVGGGLDNQATDYVATVGGGWLNLAGAQYATIGGGGPSDPSSPSTWEATRNRVTDQYGTIGGGGNNEAEFYGTVGGGRGNRARFGTGATVAGGLENEAGSTGAAVGGGMLNHAAAGFATIAGGGPTDLTSEATRAATRNRVLDNYGTVGGGGGNQAGSAGGDPEDATYATVPGGQDNTASGAHSFAAGRQAKAVHEGTFVWADSIGNDFTSTGPFQFLVRANGGVGLGTASPVAQLHVAQSIEGSADPTNHVAVIENTDTFLSGPGPDVLALKLNVNNPGVSSNYITFFDSDEAVGAIEDNGSGGIAFNSSAADFAEYLPRRDPGQLLAPGEIAGLASGQLSRETAGAERLLVVSSAPAFVGNAPPEAERDDYALAAFMGQVPVKVRGAIRAGDYVVPSGRDDGTGVALPADEVTPALAGQVVGRALESSEEAGVKLVKVLVGLPEEQVWASLLAARDEQIATLLAENATQEARLTAQDERIERFEAENDALEARLVALEQALAAGNGVSGNGVSGVQVSGVREQHLVGPRLLTVLDAMNRFSMPALALLTVLALAGGVVWGRHTRAANTR